MSILIKGMKMPTCCEECTFVRIVDLDRWKCELSGCNFNSWDVGWGDEEENKYIRHSSCPLVGLPPHGRLIDTDALDKMLEFIGEAEAQIYGHNSWGFVNKCRQALEDAPTIIPAEEGE